MPNFNTFGPFALPHGLPLNKQLGFCLSVINRYKEELSPLRRENTVLKKQKQKVEEEVLYWKQKYQEEKKEREEKEKEIARLKTEIEKLTKTNRRYQVALFDHGNFKSPFNDEKQAKGGQKGHEDTNREAVEDYSSFRKKRLFVKTCQRCHRPLKRVWAVRRKILLDIVLNPRVVKLILESERQWCPNCKKEINAKDPRTLPFTEYGLNTFMLVLTLRFKCHLSLSSIASAITISHGLKLSKSHIVSILRQAKFYLKYRYEELIKTVRKNEVVFSDETGWLVKGQSAWMWIMAGEKQTIYFAAESRGGGIAKELYGESRAYTMHDGFASYAKSAPLAKQCYCWAHFLRYCFEETVTEKKNSLAMGVRDQLVEIYHLKGQRTDLNHRQLKDLLTKKLDDLLNISSPLAIVNMQQRLRSQKEGLINSLLFTPNGTNNLAEQELRPMVLNKKISFGSDTFSGMETTATLGSIVQTCSKRDEDLIPSLKFSLQEGIQQKYPQYFHPVFYDSS